MLWTAAPRQIIWSILSRSGSSSTLSKTAPLLSMSEMTAMHIKSYRLFLVKFFMLFQHYNELPQAFCPRLRSLGGLKPKQDRITIYTVE